MAKPLFLSASRIDTFLFCSQKYAATYIHRLPDAGNDGSRRGSVCHEVLELLLRPRHYKRYSQAIHHGTCTEVPQLWRCVRRFAARFGVDDHVNLKMIDTFIMTGLRFEFFGPKGTFETMAEKEFTIQVDDPERGMRYSMRGFIDKTHFEDEA